LFKTRAHYNVCLHCIIDWHSFVPCYYQAFMLVSLLLLICSQGGHYKWVSPPNDSNSSSLTAGSPAAAAGGAAFQPGTVAIIFPSSFCSQLDSSSTGYSNSSSSSASSNAAKLSSLLHELGHALHFLLSATAAGASVGDSGCWAGIDLCEAASHVTERMARDARCLQVCFCVSGIL
jgi:hypothetical protein